MRLYLGMCCFNLPCDGQTQARILFETEAKMGTAGGIPVMLPGEALALRENRYEN